MFFKEFNHFFRDPVPDDSSSGTSDFNKDNEIHEPDDCYCESCLNEYREYVSEMVDEFLQDSFDVIQEGSHKTNTRRKIHKLEHEAKKHDINLKIDKYHSTNASTERNRKTGDVSKDTVYVNPRDIYSTKNKDVKNIFNHEKNHVLIDKRKHREVDGYNRSAIIYKGEKDVDDIKLIKAFINSHRSMIKTPHSADVDEYLADLNSARETSFRSMINTLSELYLPENKKNLKGLKKYHYEDLKKQIIINHDNMNRSPRDMKNDVVSPTKEVYEENKKLFNAVIGKDTRGFKPKEDVDLRGKLSKFKKIYETYESYVNYVRSRNVDIDSVISSYVDAYNADLDMRIAFLKYAKDIYSPRSKPKPEQIKEYCINDPLNDLMQQQGIPVEDTSKKSNGIWIDVIQEFSNCLRNKLDMSKYSNKSFNEIFDDLLHYTFIMEAAMDEAYIQEAYDAVTGKEIPIDHAYTMDEMKERTFTEEKPWNTEDSLKLFKKLPKDLQDFLRNGDISDLDKDYGIDGYGVEEFSLPEHLDLAGTSYNLKDDDPMYNAIDFATDGGGNDFVYNPSDGLYYSLDHEDYDQYGHIHGDSLSSTKWSELINHETVQESKMPAKKRNSLDNKDFGLVYKDDNGKTIRKYPLNDKAHVASAARLFGHCPDKYKKHLANKILRKAHEFGMDTSGWDTVNKAAKQ